MPRPILIYFFIFRTSNPRSFKRRTIISGLHSSIKLSHKKVRCRLTRQHTLLIPRTTHTFLNLNEEIYLFLKRINQWQRGHETPIPGGRTDVRASRASDLAGSMCHRPAHRTSLHLDGPSRQHRRHKQTKRVCRRGGNPTAETEQHTHLQSWSYFRSRRTGKGRIKAVAREEQSGDWSNPYLSWTWGMGRIRWAVQ
jgi:hypothetical protein